MILVLLGTNPYPFARLMDAMGEYARKSGVRVIAQSGNTPPHADVECHPFVAHSQLVEWIEKADVVVCQGGFGSLSDCISHGAKTVAVPRSVQLNESVDDQAELVRALAEEGLVVPVYEISELPDAIDAANSLMCESRASLAMARHVADTLSDLMDD